MMFDALPKDDDALVLRSETRQYGFPAPATFAKWASRPTDCPVDLPYTLVGRHVAYRAGDLRRLRQALTYQHSAERSVAAGRRRDRRDGR